MNRKLLLVLLLFGVISTALLAQTALERQKEYLNDILQINIKQRFKENTRRVTFQDSTWEDWLLRTGELPPDFAQMPSIPMLPAPLTIIRDGKEHPITTLGEWEKKREWIKKEYQHWIAGSTPPAPEDMKVEVLADEIEGKTRIQLIKLRFGPQYKASMTLELMIPIGNGPFPVYMTQWTHRGWAQLAVRRGYIGCVYAAADAKDDTEAYQALYPHDDFSMLMRRAWGASRVVDYLLTRKEVNDKQIAITGHSRNGKQSLWAAAFDERIAAVIASSSGTGGDAPWRYGDPQYASETLDYVTALNGHWFHPRLRFFFGREDKLPIDQNLLGALIAPRALLYHYSIVEKGLNSWANEQCYYSVKRVYDFMDVPDNIGVLTRMGEHAVAARDVEKSIDFLDIHFKRRKLTWQNNLYFTYNYDAWEQEHLSDEIAADTISPITLKERYQHLSAFRTDREKIIENLRWLLGNEPPGVKANKPSEAIEARHDWINKIISEPKVRGAKAIHLGPYDAIGDHISGILYCPVDQSGNIKYRENGKIPAVIYLHQYAYSTGYAKGYHKERSNGNGLLFEKMIENGFAVLAIDMLGFGTRIEEGTNFYARFPQWSKMGKMIADVTGCLDALEMIEYVDNKQIYLLGNTIGGSVALMTAALDDRVAGVAVVAAFSPWRTSDEQYPSLKTYAHLHGFIPRLGLFAERPKQVPVDFDEIIAAIAPKPVMIIAPQLDRYMAEREVRRVLDNAKGVYRLYGAEDELLVEYPREINRMTSQMNHQVGHFFSKLYNKN
ncbi:alpha/beta fold hydrolase [Parapedobacter tibetensis]|uniref:alpha/beta fold hydrolase n=1 Tax=Parapedobacter tibetensis TaxID=2972951 RepID=UPI00214D4FFC|nr:alpha/beta fold hydrolase [Parapedobacter tibetensis]